MIQHKTIQLTWLPDILRETEGYHQQQQQQRDMKRHHLSSFFIFTELSSYPPKSTNQIDTNTAQRNWTLIFLWLVAVAIGWLVEVEVVGELESVVMCGGECIEKMSVAIYKRGSYIFLVAHTLSCVDVDVFSLFSYMTASR
jgi:hypothetical protein